ncbi:unnamed protein product [Trichobilharzia regenti]|nr:unnamed protein product [Trichobilharzia regenti]
MWDVHGVLFICKLYPYNMGTDEHTRPINVMLRSMLGDSRSLVLRVHLPKAGITKTTAFDAQMTVGQACERIRAQVREFDQTDGGECVLFNHLM